MRKTGFSFRHIFKQAHSEFDVEGHIAGGVVVSLALVTIALICKHEVRSSNAFRWVLAAGAGMAVFTFGLLVGLHNYDQGTPIRLAGLFGFLVFAAAGFIIPGHRCHLWSGALLFFASSLCYYTPNLYHHERFIGNHQFSSGKYWHPFFTGVYARSIAVSGLPENWMKPAGFDKIRNISFTINGGEKSMNPNSIIFSAEETEKIGYIFGGEAPFWTPTGDQIQKLESLLPKYLKRYPPIDDKPVRNVLEYGRQYFGVTKNDRKLIYLNAFCNPSRFDRRWEKEIISVCDGGSCYFQVYFNPATKEFIHLNYNGQA
jgi:hypothetical protein